jgi:hypothetical protein
MSIVHQEFFDDLYNEFQKTVSKLECTAENFIDFLVKAMENVEQYSRKVKDQIVLHGLEKKELVEDILKRFFENVKDNLIEDYETIKVELSALTNKTIDILISASKGHLNFNVEEFGKCGCFATRKKQNKFIPKDISDVKILTDQVYDKVKGMIKNKEFNANNFIVLVTIVMQVVEQTQNLTGEEKKQLAIRVIKKIVMEIPMQNKEIIELII